MGMLSIFIHPGNLDASDLLLIAWNPGQELLKTGTVYAEYPYPMWTVVVTLPLAMLTQQTAMLVMYFCNMLMLAASLAFFLSIFDWVLTPILFACFTSLCGFFLPVLTSLWLGQLTIFSLFILALTTYSYLNQRWTWLGIALGLSFIKPQIMILLVGLLLLQTIWQRRWKVLLGFAIIVILLVLISLPFVSNPAQILGGGIKSHLRDYILFTSTIWGVTMSMGLHWIVPLVISLGLTTWLAWIWLPILLGRETSNNRILYLFSAVVMVNLIVIPYSWMHNLALLFLPIGYSLSLMVKMNGMPRIAWLLLLFIVTHPLMVILFLVMNSTGRTQAYQIIPALILLLMMIYLEYKTKSLETLHVKQPVSR